MTETTANAPRPAGRGSDLGIFAAVAIVIVGLIYLVAGGSEREFNRSAMGFQGLVTWLKDQDVEARTFTGGGGMVRDALGLRILPLYDTDLTVDADSPETPEERLFQTTQRDLDRRVVQQKIQRQPTLVVLPKWRSGLYLTNRAHRTLLIPRDEIVRIIRQVDINVSRNVDRDQGGWRERQVGDDRIGLFHAQTLSIGSCEPIIGTRRAMILGRCPISSFDQRDEDQSHFWLLVDPDLASNHGIQWSENADILARVIREIAGEKPVVLDLSTRVFTVNRDWQAEQRERTWDDFARMFAWPFTMIWIAFGLLGALVLWRAVTRYGPLDRIYEDQPHAAKEVSIDAKARLLRLADHDTALLGDHIRSRLQSLVSDLMGPHRPPDQDPLATLTKLVNRKNPALAQELASAAEIPEARLGQAEILRRLDRFESCYDKVSHEFGRVKQPS